MYIIFLISLFILLSTPLSYIGGGSNIVYLDEKDYKKIKKTITFINITSLLFIGILTSIYYFNGIDLYILIGTFCLIIEERKLENLIYIQLLNYGLKNMIIKIKQFCFGIL